MPVVSTQGKLYPFSGETASVRAGLFCQVRYAGLSDLRLLAEVGWKPGAANLRPVTDKTDDVLWVCPAHYKEHDPGLPVLPEQS